MIKWFKSTLNFKTISKKVIKNKVKDLEKAKEIVILKVADWLEVNTEKYAMALLGISK